ncbi:MAG: hypothetical protein LC650_00870 [Actinobacteria bacterium]|nr:hypothetical protein [Actinomycetota bacterium]
MSNLKVLAKNLPYGVYVWRNADGSTLSDSEGNILSLNGIKNDLNCIKKMRDAATALGSGDGQPAFIPGSRQVSDSEYEDQMEAFKDGDPIPGDYDA